MSKMDISKIQGLLVGQLIISIIGGLLIVFSDFAGFYHYDYYNKIEKWGNIYLGSGILSSILIAIVAFGLFLSAYHAFKILREKDGDSQTIIKLENIAKKYVLISITITIVGALYFVINEIIVETQEWWLDTGFYGGVVGGALALIFIKMINDSIQ